MLQTIIHNFLEYCKHYQFSTSTIEAFTTRLNELDRFLDNNQLHSVKQITYHHLMEFVASGTVSNHIKKVRVWTLHQFFLPLWPSIFIVGFVGGGISIPLGRAGIIPLFSPPKYSLLTKIIAISNSQILNIN